ncbi:myelin protein zero-like protein 3 [Heterodontus francisci]|uniref:myelin protein zero-like protein 3 n=1 Tax=Heterodontus francisci TaxID=7792 RepID=UPI00355C502F
MSAGDRHREPIPTRTRTRALLLLLLLLVPGTVALEISLTPKVRGFIGEDVELNCNFRSSLPITERLTVDWFYRPANRGSKHAILHYQSEMFPALSGPFKDRVLWKGEVRKGKASIILKNLTQSDNGTFSCVVQNPPDVSSEMPSTTLTVTEKVLPFRLSVAVMLVLLVVIPSLLVVAVLLLWMGKRFSFFGSGYKNASIEVVEGMAKDENDLGNSVCLRCAACLQDSDEEDEDFHQFCSASESIT